MIVIESFCRPSESLILLSTIEMVNKISRNPSSEKCCEKKLIIACICSSHLSKGMKPHRHYIMVYLFNGQSTIATRNYINVGNYPKLQDF